MSNTIKITGVAGLLLLVGILVWLMQTPPVQKPITAEVTKAPKENLSVDTPSTKAVAQEAATKLLLVDFNADGQMERIELMPRDGKAYDQVPLVVWSDGSQTIIQRTESVEFPRPQLIEVVAKSELAEYGIANALGDAIVVTKLESSSAVIYWNGAEFRSKWVGD